MTGLTFDVERDFAPITLLANAPNVIGASQKLGVATIKDLIDKSKMRKLTYGSPGVGSQLHLAAELLKERTGIELDRVPYRGSSQALNDLLGDHIDLLVTNLPAVLPAIQANSVVPIAMTTAKRSPLLPDVPTLTESGIPGIEVTSWYGLLAPRAIPGEVRDAVFQVTREILETPALQNKLQAQRLTAIVEAPDQFAERIRRETALWREVIKSKKIIAQ